MLQPTQQCFGVYTPINQLKIANSERIPACKARAAHLQQAERGGAHEVQVLRGAVQRHAVAQSVHKERTNLGARCQDDLVA